MNKVSKIPNDAFLPVPKGTKIRYQHYYIRRVIDFFVYGKHTEPRVSPPILIGTAAWLVDDKTGEELTNTRKLAIVHPNDTAIKKLGRLKAHNRCVKAFLNQ
jgi:hypothetical protein